MKFKVFSDGFTSSDVKIYSIGDSFLFVLLLQRCRYSFYYVSAKKYFTFILNNEKIGAYRYE